MILNLFFYLILSSVNNPFTIYDFYTDSFKVELYELDIIKEVPCERGSSRCDDFKALYI